MEDLKKDTKGKKDDQIADKTAPKKKYDVHAFGSWCKSCGICIAFCPVRCLSADENGKPYVSSDTCIGCGMCEIRCPDFAITVTERKEGNKTAHGKPKG